MKIGVYLLARPQFEKAYQDFLTDFLPDGERDWNVDEEATPAERLVEFAGRICYMSFGQRQITGTNADYIRKLIRNGHESVLEHVAWTVLISGVSRAFTHQLVRHRVGFAFSQLSQQYHDESNMRFVEPPGMSLVPELAQIWHDAMRDSQAAYRKIIAKLSAPTAARLAESQREQLRAVRSLARSVLPNASETVIVATINARALRHFLKVRGAVIGDSEMRRVSAALLETMRPEGPALFCDFSIKHPGDGLPLVRHDPLA